MAEYRLRGVLTTAILAAEEQGYSRHGNPGQESEKVGGVSHRTKQAQCTEHQPDEKEDDKAFGDVPSGCRIKAAFDPKETEEAIIDSRKATEKGARDIKLPEVRYDGDKEYEQEHSATAFF